MTNISKAAYKFANGNVMAFDQFGQQMPEYQGRDACERSGFKIGSGDETGTDLAAAIRHLAAMDTAGLASRPR